MVIIMKIRFNPLTALMFIAVYFSHSLEIYILAYLVMAAHEAAHLAAAAAIGLKPESITFSPFGVCLRLKNKIVRSFADEIILYSAGPLINGLFALTALLTKNAMMYKLNTALMVMNLLPVIPLDGGMICLRLLSQRMGRTAAKRVLNVVSAVFSFMFLSVAVAGLCLGYINISMFMIAALLIGNVLTSKEMYNVDFISTLSGEKKRNGKVKMVMIDGNHSLLDAAKSFSPAYNTVAVTKDNNGKISGMLSESEILEKITAGAYENKM